LTIQSEVAVGQIQFPDGEKRPEHGMVSFVVPEVQATPKARVQCPRLGHPEQAADCSEEIIEGRADVRLRRIIS